jgi:hypothetical protein
MKMALFNVTMYQTIWFACILGGNTWAVGCLALIVLHLLLSPKRWEDLRMMGIVLCGGLLVDGILLKIGFFSFRISGFPIPFWLMIIWLGLATTPNHSLAWMKRKPLLSMFFGALGGPAAYWAGVRLGAATFQWDLAASLGLLAIIWAAIWTSIMHISCLRVRITQDHD